MAPKSHQHARYYLGKCYLWLYLALHALWYLGKTDNSPELQKKSSLLSKAIQYFKFLCYVTSDIHYWHNSPSIKLWTQLCTHFTVSFTYLTAWIADLLHVRFYIIVPASICRKSQKKRKQNAEIFCEGVVYAHLKSHINKEMLLDHLWSPVRGMVMANIKQNWRELL